MFKFRIIINIYFTCAVCNEFLSQRFNVVADKDGADLVTDTVSQLLSLAQQF